jgi:hypothetical protein
MAPAATTPAITQGVVTASVSGRSIATNEGHEEQSHSRGPPSPDRGTDEEARQSDRCGIEQLVRHLGDIAAIDSDVPERPPGPVRPVQRNGGKPAHRR